MAGSHLLSLSAERSQNEGNFVHVGIVDSVLDLKPPFGSEYKINRRENYVASETEDTTGHGTSVFDFVSVSAPEAVFSFYRVIAENPKTGRGEAKRGNVVDAIYDASQHGVDVLNLSVGVCHFEDEGHDCGGKCRIADEARLAVQEDDVTLVAATGNKDEADAVTCPALVDEVIGVGGFVSYCTTPIQESETSSQYWVRTDELYGPFCGQRGCGDDQCCETARRESNWEGNVPFRNAEPDVLAPVIRTGGDPPDVSLSAGTSFAAPLVSGSIASMLSDLIAEEGIKPAPVEIRNALRDGAVEIDDGEIPKFHETNSWNILTNNG